MSAIAQLSIFDRAHSVLEGDIEIDSVSDWITRALLAIVLIVITGCVAAAFSIGMVFLLAPMIGRLDFLSSNVATAIFFISGFWLVPALAGWFSRRLSIVSNAPLRETIETIDIEDVRTDLALSFVRVRGSARRWRDEFPTGAPP